MGANKHTETKTDWARESKKERAGEIECE